MPDDPACGGMLQPTLTYIPTAIMCVVCGRYMRPRETPYQLTGLPSQPQMHHPQCFNTWLAAARDEFEEMPKEHEKELREFADEAATLAQQIHQEWGSATDGGFQVRVNRDMPAHGPDHALLNVERALGSVLAAIGDYLRRP